MKELSHNLQKVYQEMSQTFSAYQTKTGWNCAAGCGKCCINPNVEASALEMIPMAFKIIMEETLDEWIERLKNPPKNHCFAFIPGSIEGQGKCSMYNERPSVCRMFGVGGYFDKKHEATLAICRVLRDTYSINDVPTKLDRAEVPMIADWYFKMSSLDPDLMKEKLPLNQALLKALDKVALYSQYEKQEM